MIFIGFLKHYIKKFSITPDAEITLEANPDDIISQKLIDWKTIGINRFSIGIQSFFDEELKWMNLGAAYSHPIL